MHELVKVGIGAVKDINATGSDLAVDSGKFSVDDVVPHKQSIVSGSVPGGVESTGFESIKGRKDTINVEIAVFAADRV